MYFKFICVIIIIICLFLSYKIRNERFSTQINTKKLIDKICVINLDRRKDRLKHIDTGLKKNKLEYERFAACDGTNLNKYKKDIEKYFDKNHKLNNGQVGCALSHIKIWEKILKNGNKNTLILEDDAVLPDNLLERINNINTELPKKYNMILLGCCSCEANIINNKNFILEGSKNSNANWCATAYIINYKFVKKILELISNNKLKLSIDNYLQQKIYPKYDFYISLPPFIKQNKELESDIIMGDLGNKIKITF